MVNTDKLRGVIAENKLSQTDVASMLGMTAKTFYTRMKDGVFKTDEVAIMIDRLHITDPMPIFFA